MADPACDFTTLADPDDFCRQCRGNGMLSERDFDGTRRWRRCDACGGHGCKTIIILEDAQ